MTEVQYRPFAGSLVTGNLKPGGGNGLGLAHSYSAPLISSVNGFKVFSEKTKKLNLDNPTKYSWLEPKISYTPNLNACALAWAEILAIKFVQIRTFKASMWKGYMFGWMSHITHVSLHVKWYVLILIKWLISLTCLNFSSEQTLKPTESKKKRIVRTYWRNSEFY